MKRLFLVVHFALAVSLLQVTYAESIPLKSEDGTLVLPVLINNRITLDFVLDSGASDVSIPLDVFSTLRRAGTISESDLLPATAYRLADGTTQRQVRFRIRSLTVGSLELRGVVASVAPAQGELLLGQSFLRRLRSWSIDNQRSILIIDEPGPDTGAEPQVAAAKAPLRYDRPSPLDVPPKADRSQAPLPKWMRCTPAAIRAGECDQQPPSRTPLPSRRGCSVADCNDEPDMQTPPPRWMRCTPAQIRAGECN